MTDDVIGKTLLVGVTHVDADGAPTEVQQYAGRIVAIDDVHVTIETTAGETMEFPPEFEPAEEGEYQLRATGEVVTNPDFLATWTVAPPSE
jgi:replicative superfamily II helicase